MDQPEMLFTAVYLKGTHGFVGFVEELPAVTSHGQTIDEARASLRRMALQIFDEERVQAAELLKGKDVVRERFRVPIPVVAKDRGKPSAPVRW